jgi:hypothetical protein
MSSSLSSNMSNMSSGGGSQSTKPEKGDYIINWHLQYCANIFLQQETQLNALEDLVKAEIMKIRTDGEFIKSELDGSHTHLTRLKNEDKDLRAILDSISHLSDLFRTVIQRSAQRII